MIHNYVYICVCVCFICKFLEGVVSRVNKNGVFLLDFGVISIRGFEYDILAKNGVFFWFNFGCGYQNPKFFVNKTNLLCQLQSGPHPCT
jgi:hypothetical protein